MKISFHQQAPVTLKDRTKLKAFIQDLARKERTIFDNLTFIFCTDDYLLEINRSFLNHDYYTDIITFDMSESGSAVTGEIYISIDTVKDNAKTHNVSFTNELHRVMFHGILHLCGYGDKKKDEIVLMRNKEDIYLKKYFPES